jgi:hypothetical protein
MDVVPSVFWIMKLIWVIFRDYIPTSQYIYCNSVMKANQLSCLGEQPLYLWASYQELQYTLTENEDFFFKCK